MRVKRPRYNMYISNRKKDGVHEQAVTIYNEHNTTLFSDTSRIREEDMLKYDKTLLAIEKGIQQFRSLVSNGELSEDIKLYIYIGTKTIYNWIEKEECPPQYIDIFSNILLELSLLVNETEIIYSTKTKARYIKTKEKIEKVTDLWGNYIK